VAGGYWLLIDVQIQLSAAFFTTLVILSAASAEFADAEPKDRYLVNVL